MNEFMKIEIIEQDKNSVDFTIDNMTISEVMREYLNKEGVEFAAWRREHPNKPLLMKVKSTSNVNKSISDAVSAIKKDCNTLVSGLKK